MLIVFGGRPATGKTTTARLVAQRCGAAYLRIDAIEQALRSAQVLAGDVGPAGYAIAYALSEANLKLGQAVVADCVNPLPITRAAWRAVAASASSTIVEIEVICSDPVEHQRRAEHRASDIAGLSSPNWSSILAYDYEPWREPRMLIDTAMMSAADAASKILAGINRRSVSATALLQGILTAARSCAGRMHLILTYSSDPRGTRLVCAI